MNTLEELQTVASRLPEAAQRLLLAKALELAGAGVRAQALETLRAAGERLALADSGEGVLPAGLSLFDRYAGAFDGRISRDECHER